jgi:3-methylcrotonyl-CoA carboxylase alpha subunit
MDEATREDICAAAVRAAKAVDYEGAGTIEFIADASEGLRADRIFFMEMNTRLQVEHPVTEEITGVDLVEWQLRVASGEPLPKRQEELSINGHAIEARLYAEDPSKGFLPSTGRLERFYLARPNRRDGESRVDTGVEEGSEISPFYDPMIAKMIVHRGSRVEAAEALAAKLGYSHCYPVKWNVSFLRNLVSHPEFIAAEIDTGFIERNLEDVLPSKDPPLEILEAAGLMAVQYAQGLYPQSTVDLDQESEKTIGPSGFRLNAAPRPATILVEFDGAILEAPLTGKSIWDLPKAETVDGGIFAYDYEGWSGFFKLHRAGGTGQASPADGAIIALMPGKVIAVDVSEGQTVTAGQRLMVLEAMKMEHALTAPFDGTVTELNASEGEQVQVEAVLAVVEPSGED